MTIQSIVSVFHFVRRRNTLERLKKKIIKEEKKTCDEILSWMKIKRAYTQVNGFCIFSSGAKASDDFSASNLK